MVRYVAIGFGVVLMIVGVLGWVPAAKPDGKLFGLFAVDHLHNFVHLGTGLLSLLVGFTTERAARGMFRFVGVVYAILTVLGFFAGEGQLFGVMAMNMADHVLHAILALLTLAIGFSPSPEHRYVQPGASLNRHQEYPRGV